MKKAVLYLHGRGGSAQEAEHYRPFFPESDVIGLDYAGDTPWETRPEILRAYDALAARCDAVALVANSIGAFFAMNALQDRAVERAFLISPVVNMERLITDMMGWAGVTEGELQRAGEIDTRFGERLSWKYLCYVRENPIRWSTPTHVLWADGDHLTARETMVEFCDRTGATLTVMRGGEHWFHTEAQMAFLDNWLRRFG